MGKLIQNERTKLYRKISTWVLMGVIILLMAAILILSKIAGGSSAWYDSWESDYEETLGRLQMWVQKDPDDLYQKYQLKEVQYLYDNQIAPTDWRSEVVYRICDAQRQIEEAQLSQEEGGTQQPGQMAVDTEALQKQVDELTRVLESNSWQEYIRMQMEELQASDSLNDAERQVEMEILQMYLDYDIAPMPSGGYFSYYVSSVPDLSWKDDQLDIIRANKLALVRGQVDNNPIDSTTRASLQQQIDVATERLKTGIAPVSATSFAGLMDASTGSISLISLLIIVLAGGLIATEFSTGTIKLLLITPHKRYKIFWAKVILMLEVILMTAGAMFVVAFLVSGMLTGFEGIAAMQVLSLFGRVIRMPYLLFVLFKYVLYLLPVVFYMSLALMLSAVTRKSAIAIAVSLLLMYGSQMVVLLLAAISSGFGIVLPGASFVVFANTDLSVYLPSASSGLASMMGMGSMLVDPHMTLGFSVIVLLVYTACFLWIARDSFCRRDIR